VLISDRSLIHTKIAPLPVSVQIHVFEIQIQSRCRYPDESGNRIAFLTYNQIFDIRTTLAAIFVSISGPDIELYNIYSISGPDIKYLGPISGPDIKLYYIYSISGPDIGHSRKQDGRQNG
jgi:hypothetical protein